MTEDEVAEWRHRLAEVLRDHKLRWVLDEVEQHLRLGKTSEEEIQTFDERHASPLRREFEPGLPSPSRYRAGRKARFVGTREYEPREALTVLVDAIELAVADTAEMEAEIQKQFSHGAMHYEVTLVRDDPEPAVRAVTQSDTAIRADSARKLRELLNELRSEA